MRDSHLIQFRVLLKKRIGIAMFKINNKCLIINKLILKKIWMLLFFDIIFAEEILELRISNYDLRQEIIST